MGAAAVGERGLGVDADVHSAAAAVLDHVPCAWTCGAAMLLRRAAKSVAQERELRRRPRHRRDGRRRCHQEGPRDSLAVSGGGCGILTSTTGRDGCGSNRDGCQSGSAESSFTEHPGTEPDSSRDNTGSAPSVRKTWSSLPRPAETYGSKGVVPAEKANSSAPEPPADPITSRCPRCRRLNSRLSCPRSSLFAEESGPATALIADGENTSEQRRRQLGKQAPTSSLTPIRTAPLMRVVRPAEHLRN
jgi:hypothetical protein